MAYNQAFQHPTEDLFLDILTKEEREALLNKKMEEIRKKNEALRKRHEEIEADKRQAEKLSKPIGSPTKEAKPLPGEDKPARPRGRGRPQPARPLKDKPPLKAQGRSRRREKENISNNTPSRIPPERHMYCDRLNNDSEEEQSEKESFQNGRSRFSERGSPYQQQQNHSSEIIDHHGGNQPNEFRSNNKNQNTADDVVYTGRLAESEIGPPPDPSFNFLADRGREGQGFKESPRDKSRRHPKNFGGTEFKNVTMKMKLDKGRQDGGYKGAPNSQMEMSISMTGRERRQYSEWKAERDKVDQQRIDRQKSSSGEWRRAWDAEKHPSDFDDEGIPLRSEPARRPGTLGDHLHQPHHQHAIIQTGRIGSGRFVHSEKGDERQRGDAPKARGQPAERARQGPSPRGRVRGRGRGRGRGSARVRSTSSGSDDLSRTVEQKEDLLVVKFDNSPGDDTVEVEYAENNQKSNGSSHKPVSQNGRSKSKRKSPPKQRGPLKHESGEEYWEDDIFADAELQVHQVSPEYGLGGFQPEIIIKEATPMPEDRNLSAASTDPHIHENQDFVDASAADEYIDDNVHIDEPKDSAERSRNKSSQSISTGASDEWEDIPEDDEFYQMEESFEEEETVPAPVRKSRSSTPQGGQSLQTGPVISQIPEESSLAVHEEAGLEPEGNFDETVSTKPVGVDPDTTLAGAAETPTHESHTNVGLKAAALPNADSVAATESTEGPTPNDTLKINVDLKTPESSNPLSPLAFKTPDGVTKVLDWAAEMSPLPTPENSPRNMLPSSDTQSKDQADNGEGSPDNSSGKPPNSEADQSTRVSAESDVVEKLSSAITEPSENQCAGNADPCDGQVEDKSQVDTATSKSEVDTATSKSQVDTATSKLEVDTATSKSEVDTATSKSEVDTATPKSEVETATSNQDETMEKSDESGEVTQSALDKVKRSNSEINEKSIHEEFQDYVRQDARKGSIPSGNQ